MKKLLSIGGIILCFFIGLAFHAYQNEWIIFLLPNKTTRFEDKQETSDMNYSQKKITLFFWKHGQWHKEDTFIIWSSDMAANIKTTANNWLMLLEDEKLIDTDIQILSAVITPHKELFLSLNKNLYQEQNSTYQKLMITHGLLKTLHENKIAIQSIRFLVLHQTMTDDHLNFSIPWPITGYLTNT